MESDFELLERYHKTRDPLAFTELTRRYRGLVFAAARRVTNSHHDAEDITQACFLDLAQKSDSIRESVPAWLHQQATFRAIDVLRRSAVRQRREQEGLEPPAVSDVPQWDQIGPVVDDAINQLQPDLRLPVILYYLQEFTQDEIAAMLKLSRHTVARRLRLGIVALRDQIGKSGLFVSAGILGILLKEHAVEATPASLNITLAKIGMAGIGPGSARNTLVKQIFQSAATSKISQIVMMLQAIPLVYKTVFLVALVCLTGWQWVGYTRGWSIASPYAALKVGFVPYVERGGPFGFPGRIRHMTQDIHGFWSGSRELFFAWGYAQRPEWFAGLDDHLLCHGAVDFTNIGVQSSSIEPGLLHTGLIDFDDVAQMPFQMELLQGMVSIEVAAIHAGKLDETSIAAAKSRLFESYRASLTTSVDDSAILQDPLLTSLRAAADRESYENMLRQYVTSEGRFKRILRHGRHLRELMEPAQEFRGALLDGLKQACKNNPAFAKQFRWESDAEIEKSVCDVVLHTQMNLGGSHGIPKYLMLLHKPFRHAEHDGIISFRQQIPSPIQRADIHIDDDELPGRRVAEGARALAGHQIDSIISWCDINGRSYTVQVREPWTNGIDLERIFSADQLIRASQLLGAMAGASHRAELAAERIASRMSPALFQDLQKLSSQYVDRMNRQYQALISDPAAKHDVLAVRTAESACLNSGEIR